MGQHKQKRKTRNTSGIPSMLDILKITTAIVLGISCVAIMILLCFSMYKNLDIVTILSTLLAFFSIFISIFFYFKADSASSQFYNSTYVFMNHQNEVLGRIDERFTEKFNTISIILDNLNNHLNEKDAKIQNTSNEIESILDKAINSLKDSSNVDSMHMLVDDLNQYRQQLEEKKDEYSGLISELKTIHRDVCKAETYSNHPVLLYPETYSSKMQLFLAELDSKDIQYLIKCGKRIQPSHKSFDVARKYNMCDYRGGKTPELEFALQSIKNHGFNDY